MKRDNTPVFYAFLVTVVLFYLNLFTLVAGVSFIWKDLKKLGTAFNVITVMCVLALLNYLILYKGKKYEDIFNEFEIDSLGYKDWDFSIKIYIIVSITLCLIALIIADRINQGKLTI
ncbi:MAG: hypothetical protein ABI367_11415 [Mucilaginibacter sp.]